MSAKGKGRKVGKSRRRRDRRGSGAARINCAGLKMEVPPELDLPAGAPFATAEALPSIPDDIEKLLKPLAAMATNAWRAKKNMADPETGEALEEMRRVYRFVENIFTALDDAGVRVVDSTGKTYDSGMALKVLSFDDVPGLGRDEIIKTISPSIVWQDRLLQMGEVIVGQPGAPEQGDAPPQTTPSDGPQATDDQEPVSPQASGTSGGRGPGIMPPTNGSPGLPDGQEATPSATPVDVADPGKEEDAPSKRQGDTGVGSLLTPNDTSAGDNAGHDTTSNQLEGADNEQDND